MATDDYNTQMLVALQERMTVELKSRDRALDLAERNFQTALQLAERNIETRIKYAEQNNAQNSQRIRDLELKIADSIGLGGRVWSSLIGTAIGAGIGALVTLLMRGHP